MSGPTLAALALVVPLIGAALIWMSHRRPNQRETATLVTAFALFGIVASLVPQVAAGGQPEFRFMEILPGIDLAFRVEPLGMLFAVVASLLWIVNSIYSIGYMRGNKERHQTRFYICFALALASTMGIAFSANMFSMFAFYEALTLVTYPLVTHAGTDDARRAGRTYLGVLLGTSIGFQLLAILWTWTVAGTLDFRAGGILVDRASPLVIGVLFFLYMYGIGKAAMMPVHRWLPAAMIAPTPVSALLHAVAVVKAGVFAVVKVIVYIFGPAVFGGLFEGGWLLYAAGATVLTASLIALRQDDLKRRLAYSTVSQLSYVILGAAILAPLSMVGAALHIVAHAFGKITLFFAAGAIYTAHHKTKVSELDGIGRRMPWTMGAFAVGSLSMIGVPPLVGFLSKWYILQGAIEARQGFAVVVIILSTLLNAAYFLPIVFASFFKPYGGDTAAGEAPWPMVVALTATAFGTVALFFFAGPPVELARAVAAAFAPR